MKVDIFAVFRKPKWTWAIRLTDADSKNCIFQPVAAVVNTQEEIKPVGADME